MDFTFISAVVATICGLFAVLQTHRANRFAQQIARVQGQLTTPDLQLSFMGHALQVRTIVAAPFREGRVFELPVNFVLKNNGAKTAREIELYLRLPKELLYGGSEMSTFKLKSPLKTLACKVVATSENLETLLISIPSLNPGAGFAWTSTWSLLHETVVDAKVPVKFSDGTLDVPFVAEFAWHIVVLLVQADHPPISSSVSLEVLDTRGASADRALAQHNARIGSAVLSYKKRSRKQRNKNDEPVALFVVAADALDHDPKYPVDRPKANALKSYQGFKTRHGLLVPELGVIPGSARVDDK
jgi:hypothetical protein